MAYVEIDDLCKSFSGRVALQNMRLSIEEGELVSLLGPSGCGKTTTLRIVAGFEMPDSGAVWLNGQNLIDVSPNRRGIGIVFQNYALFPHLTAWNNIAFGMKISRRTERDIRHRVGELLDMVGLSDAGAKYPHEMSGGQQQRVALARAIAIEPRILLLDEPLSALDAVVRVQLRDEIRRIQNSLGIATLYVTHDQEEALAISDRIVVMRDGRIEQIGTSEEIYSQPASGFVAGFIGKMNQISGRLVNPRLGIVQCGSYQLRVPVDQTEGLADGCALTVLVRPEAVLIAPFGAMPATKDAAGDNEMTARIDAVTFLGSIKRIGLVADGQRLVADISATSAGRLHRGDMVRLSFPFEACRLLANDQSNDGVRN